MTARPAAVGRNAPCPCGSGRRFKDCHGSLGAPAAPAVAAPRGYRPDGPEWDALDEDRRQRLGGRMEEALALQNAGNDRDAERAYREVLAEAPDTHDALHMLGVARWRLGDLTEAARLIERALALRAPYPAVVKNLKSVRRARDARAHGGVERLSGLALPRVLPMLAGGATGADDPARAPRRPGEPLHLILDSERIDGDVAFVFGRLVDLLAPWRPVAWRRDAPAGDRRVRRLAPDPGDLPGGGVHVHVGLECDYDWLARAHPRRVVAIGVHAGTGDWLVGLRRLARDGTVPLLPLFLTAAQAARFGVDGPLLPDLAPPARATATRSPVREGAPRVGIVCTDPGRDAAHAVVHRLSQRCALLEELSRRRVDVVVRDPGRLRHLAGDLPRVVFESRGARPLEDFVASIDVLAVPPRPWALEGLQPEIALARAAGVPVVLPASSIHAPPSPTAGVLAVADDEAAADAIAGLVRAGAPRLPPDARPPAPAQDAVVEALAHALALGPREVPS